MLQTFFAAGDSAITALSYPFRTVVCGAIFHALNLPQPAFLTVVDHAPVVADAFELVVYSSPLSLEELLEQFRYQAYIWNRYLNETGGIALFDFDSMFIATGCAVLAALTAPVVLRAVYTLLNALFTWCRAFVSSGHKFTFSAAELALWAQTCDMEKTAGVLKDYADFLGFTTDSLEPLMTTAELAFWQLARDLKETAEANEINSTVEIDTNLNVIIAELSVLQSQFHKVNIGKRRVVSVNNRVSTAIGNGQSTQEQIQQQNIGKRRVFSAPALTFDTVAVPEPDDSSDFFETESLNYILLEEASVPLLSATAAAADIVDAFVDVSLTSLDHDAESLPAPSTPTSDPPSYDGTGVTDSLAKEQLKEIEKNEINEQRRKNASSGKAFKDKVEHGIEKAKRGFRRCGRGLKRVFHSLRAKSNSGTSAPSKKGLDPNWEVRSYGPLLSRRRRFSLKLKRAKVKASQCIDNYKKGLVLTFQTQRAEASADHQASRSFTGDDNDDDDDDDYEDIEDCDIKESVKQGLDPNWEQRSYGPLLGRRRRVLLTLKRGNEYVRRCYKHCRKGIEMALDPLPEASE